MPGLHRRIRSMIEDAESFLARLPSDAVGVIFMEGERAVQPDVNILNHINAIPALRAASGRRRPRFHGQCSNATGGQSLSPTRLLPNKRLPDKHCRDKGDFVLAAVRFEG